MLRIKHSKIVNFAYDHFTESDITILFERFLGEYQEENVRFEEDILLLFNEWLIYEYEYKKGKRIIDIYYEENPDNLSKKLLEELKQIIKTETYDLFEIQDIVRGKYFTAYGLFTGKNYKIYDKLASSSIPEQGTIPLRIAKVNQKWHIIGTNTVVLLITYTDDAKEAFKIDKKDEVEVSCRISIPYLKIKEENKMPNKQQVDEFFKKLEAKRNQLIKKYKKVAKKYKCDIDINTVLDFINLENYDKGLLDLMEDLEASGMPFVMMADNLELFQDLWNHFPHQKLDNESPVEKLFLDHGALSPTLS